MTLITGLVLAYNEESFILPCVESILAFQMPEDCEVEILVVDGRSTDKTRELIEAMRTKDPRVRLVDNPKRITPCGMNAGIRAARGEYIAIFGSHASYPSDYLIRCLETSRRTDADNVGGIAITLPGGEGYQAQLVQALTTHKFGVGNSGFRTGAPEGPADTVTFGFYKASAFKKVGFFDERLVRAQDYELNRRLLAAGGKIWLNPKIQVRYHNMARLAEFYTKQLKKEAPYNTYMWYLAPYSFAWRHAITGLFALGIIGGTLLSPASPFIALPFFTVMLVYAVLAVLSALQQAVRYRQPLHLFFLPSCFFIYHFLHGVGILTGLLRLAVRIAPVQKQPEPWPGASQKRAWPRKA